MPVYDDPSFTYDNDIEALRSRLAVSLRDADMEVWSEEELTDLLGWATASMYPRVARQIALPVYPTDEDQEDYELPEGIREISRVDVGEVATDRLLFSLPPGTWEIYGDVWMGTAKLFVNRRFTSEGRYLIVHGYGLFNLTASLPPPTLVPYILAKAQAEAISRMLPSRAQFENWMKINQKENVSVNELAQMLNQAEQKAERELSRLKTWRKPKPAR